MTGAATFSCRPVTTPTASIPCCSTAATATSRFGAPSALPAARLPWFDATSGDFNGDGRRDIAAVGMCCEVNVFLNNGSGGFTRTQLSPATEFTDVTTADMNGDGRLDLIATSGHYAPTGAWDDFPGAVYIFLGSGTGGFAPGVAHRHRRPRRDVGRDRRLQRRRPPRRRDRRIARWC